MTIGGGDLVELDSRGFVSDTLSGALVAADGTIDWWCPRRFDADPLFTRLLDPHGACLRVGPTSPGPPTTGEQDYLDGTLVLRTVLAGRESLVEVVDLVPWEGSRPSGRLVRRVHVLRGPAEVVVEVVPGGAAGTGCRAAGAGGTAHGETRGARRGGGGGGVSVWSEGVVFDGTVVRCGLPMLLSSQPPPSPARPLRRLVATGTARLDTGDGLVVTVDPPGGAEEPLSIDAAMRLQKRTATAWRRVADGVEVDGRYREAATRSVLVVRSLSGIGGAPVAAPVTSLPRALGGERNTDGRLCSPATAGAWAEAAAGAGLAEEADAAAGWLAAALELDPPMAASLAADAEVCSAEAHLAGFAGWRRSQPVVSGSDAPDRRSAEPGAAVVAAAARLASTPAGPQVLSRWDRVVVHADWLAEHWNGPDASVWDDRGPDRGWRAPVLATRRALALAATEARRRHPLDLDAAGWQAAVRDIESWLHRSGVEPDGVLRSGLRVDGAADAGLVRAATWGPWPPDDAVITATLAHTVGRLAYGPWLHPYPGELDDGLPGSEPPSVVATLWLAGALAAARRWDEAHERITAAIGLAGPLLLLPESTDVPSATPLGNRPSAAAHVALLEACVALQRAPS